MTADSPRDDRERISTLWGSSEGTWRSGEVIHWLEHPAVQQRINRMVASPADRDRYQWFIRTCFGDRLPVERALTLGCGFGEFERGVARLGFCRRHDAVDLSEGAIAHAVREASALGYDHIHYRVADLNTLRLEPGSYDAIFGISSIHHVTALEELFEQVRHGLKRDGYFLLDEYVGPSRFQWSDEQLAAVNAELDRMPAALKQSRVDPGRPRSPAIRPSVQEVIAVDPSEAVRSDEILALLQHHFDVVSVSGYGGSLLHLLLEEIAGNFDDERYPGALDYLHALFRREDELIAAGRLQHDFATIIARRRE